MTENRESFNCLHSTHIHRPSLQPIFKKSSLYKDIMSIVFFSNLKKKTPGQRVLNNSNFECNSGPVASAQPCALAAKFTFCGRERPAWRARSPCFADVGYLYSAAKRGCAVLSLKEKKNCSRMNFKRPETRIESGCPQAGATAGQPSVCVMGGVPTQ